MDESATQPTRFDHAAPLVGESLLRDLRRAIDLGELSAGDRLPPLRRLAQDYGISYSSARDAVGRLESEGLVSRRHGSQCVVLKSPSSVTAQSDTVAMFIEPRAHLYGTLMHELMQRMDPRRHQPLPISHDQNRGLEQFNELFELWREHPPSTIVLTWDIQGLVEKIEEACGPHPRKIAALYWNITLEEQNWHMVQTQVQVVGQLVTDYFLARGHERIGYVSYRRVFPEDQPQDYRRKRHCRHTKDILAIGRELRRRGMRHALTMFYPPLTGDTTSFGEATQQKLRDWLSGPNRPTAVFGQDFRLAGVLRAANDLGMKIGRDLDLLGYGATPWSTHLGFDSISLQEPLVADRVMQIIDMPEEELGDTAISLTVRPVIRTVDESI